MIALDLNLNKNDASWLHHLGNTLSTFTQINIFFYYNQPKIATARQTFIRIILFLYLF